MVGCLHLLFIVWNSVVQWMLPFCESGSVDIVTISTTTTISGKVPGSRLQKKGEQDRRTGSGSKKCGTPHHVEKISSLFFSLT